MADSDANPGVFDEQRILRIVELMKEHDLQEVDLHESDQRIRIKRMASPAAWAGYPPPGYPPAGYAPGPAPAAAPAVSRADVPPADVDGEHIVVIKAPMVGTFYGRPNPKAQAYVKVGDHVDPETTICIIEAMKVFNEIPAEVSGKVVAVLVGDEEPVEFGKPLFKVDTRG